MTKLPDGVNAQAIAGGMIASALIDFLVEKDIMTKDEAVAILLTASKRTAPFALKNPDASLAARIIDGIP
jgi:hypothetical protein